MTSFLESKYFYSHVTLCISCFEVKSTENHPCRSSPFTLYVLSFLGKTSAISVELLSAKQVLQNPTLSLESCRSQKRTASGRLFARANWYPRWLESGNNPEYPPRAMTNGGAPTKYSVRNHALQCNDYIKLFTQFFFSEIHGISIFTILLPLSTNISILGYQRSSICYFDHSYL